MQGGRGKKQNAIQRRLKILKERGENYDAYSDDSDDVALYCCKEEITSLLKILKECAEEGYADEFKKGFSDAVDKFIDLIQPTIKWLNNYN